MGFLSLESGFESFVKLCLNDKLQGRLKNILSDGLTNANDALHQDEVSPHGDEDNTEDVQQQADVHHFTLFD